MTQTPGTPAYMPPEVMIADPKYDSSLDVFSYGIVMIHMFSGRWPEPQVGQVRFEAGKLIPVTEAERREVFLNIIGKDHPMMDLIVSYINNNPETRSSINVAVERLAKLISKFSPFLPNRLEMLREIELVKERDRALNEMEEKRTAIVQESEIKIAQLMEEIKVNQETAEAEIDRLKWIHSSEIEQLQLRVKDLLAENKLITDEIETKTSLYKAQMIKTDVEIESKKAALVEKNLIISQMSEQLTKAREYLLAKNPVSR